MNAHAIESHVLHGPALAPQAARVNVGALLARAAATRPDATAVIEPHKRGWRNTSFAELDARADALAHGLADLGLTHGDRVALLAPPGAELVALVYALFLVGAVPVVADPGLGRSGLVAALSRAQPRAFIAVPRGHALRRLHARAFASVAIDVVVGPRRFPLARTLDQIARPARARFKPADTRAEDPAAILYTSGSTGPAKGVVYHHGAFASQIDALRSLCGIGPGSIDLACFPLFALFDPALGATCVIPPMDFSRPARCDPEAIASALREHACTSTFGSPAIWRRVVPWAREHGVTFPTLRSAWIAGAPVPLALIEHFRALLSASGDVHTPYGATECLPVSSIAGAELLALRALAEGGAGSCVGRPAPGSELALVSLHDDPIALWSDELALARGELGEVCVRGAVVTRSYLGDPPADALSKISDDAGVWHRTGDVGWIDDEDRLWLVGRKAHRIETRAGTFHPVPVENVCDLHPRVRHSALVGHGPRGAEEPVLFIEPETGAYPRTRVARELFTRELDTLRADRLRPIGPNSVPTITRTIFRRTFPLDARHNAKIRRENLREHSG